MYSNIAHGGYGGLGNGYGGYNAVRGQFGRYTGAGAGGLVDIGNEDGQMKKMCKEEVEKVEGNIEEGNDVEAKKEDNDDEWGPKKGQEAEEGKDDVKVEFEKYPEDKSDYGGTFERLLRDF